MNPPTLDTTVVTDKTVLLRADLDIDTFDHKIPNSKRLQITLNTLSLLDQKKPRKIIILSHRGRPTKQDRSLSLEPIAKYLVSNFSPDLEFVDYQPLANFVSLRNQILSSSHKYFLLENLRFWQEETNPTQGFAQELGSLGEVYVNESFATSHRDVTSIVALPKEMKNQNLPTVIGPHFAEELNNLDKIVSQSKKPLVTILSGLKKDKLDYLDGLINISDQVLVSGRLPEFMDEDYEHPRVTVAKLNPDKEDITIHSIEKFEEAVSLAKTIIVSGPMGHFEDPGHTLGTERVLIAAANNQQAFKLAGGGDTEEALKKFHFTDKFDWISVGGGAMLEYLTKHTLPGIEALK
ncbi:hypothetical protein A2382_04195 [Candidatus Woesebacteria bacterium RIFOXYB1_FULL_38_16]|uniref:Phosphoglycerate kinase n=1 Tax=Candidatus Woesebacteria bacterium RIFOXYB1_FULL_38_16 TaxID=1802538 RepID=A0A1F8CU15_9BACT|nr:MAG: hypothetical protein A2191_04270 [Candidatus Woesebacteria bacterium RIFOXYA1_FULL_38_9]OGM79772.1 MAG: hypothetical protein A2382_04195 [Candidatus Woesebacteria bacterium RIFOXYB1_FULL_38_16]